MNLSSNKAGFIIGLDIGGEDNYFFVNCKALSEFSHCGYEHSGLEDNWIIDVKHLYGNVKVDSYDEDPELEEPESNLYSNSYQVAVSGGNVTPNNRNPLGRAFTLQQKPHTITTGDDGGPAVTFPAVSGYHAYFDDLKNIVQPSYTTPLRATPVAGKSVFADILKKGTINNTFGRYKALFYKGLVDGGHMEMAYQGMSLYTEAISFPIIFPILMPVKNSSESTLISYDDSGLGTAKHRFSVVAGDNDLNALYITNPDSDAYALSHLWMPQMNGSLMAIHLNKNIASNQSLETTIVDYKCNFANSDKCRYRFPITTDLSERQRYFLHAHTGTAVFYSTKEHITGGAFSDIDTAENAIGGSFSHEKPVSGVNTLFYNNKRYIESPSGLFESFRRYEYMSTVDRRLISVFGSGENVRSFRIGVYLFIERGGVVELFFDGRDGANPLFLASGNLVYYPVMIIDTLCFGVVSNGELVVYNVKDGQIATSRRVDVGNSGVYMYWASKLGEPLLIIDNGKGEIFPHIVTRFGIVKLNDLHTVAIPEIVFPSVDNVSMEPVIIDGENGFVIRGEDNSGMFLKSGLVTIPEHQGRKFIVCGIQVNVGRAAITGNSVKVELFNGYTNKKIKEEKFDDAAITDSNGSVVMYLQTPQKLDYVKYSLTTEKVFVKDVLLVGYYLESTY